MNEKAWVLGFPQNNQEMLKQSIDIANTDTVGPIIFDKPIEAEMKYGTALKDKLNVIIVKQQWRNRKNSKRYTNGK